MSETCDGQHDAGAGDWTPGHDQARDAIQELMPEGKQTVADLRQMLERWARGELRCTVACPMWRAAEGDTPDWCMIMNWSVTEVGDECWAGAENWARLSMAVALLGEG
jgi:hypothetical protein